MARIFASTDGRTVLYEGQAYPSLPLKRAVSRLGPGDTLHIAPGRYTEPVKLTASGRAGAPITLRGDPDGGTRCEGGRNREDALEAFIPGDRDFAFIKLLNADHVVIENLNFDACWPSAIYLRGSRHVTIRNCSISRGRFGVYARSETHRSRCRHIVLDAVRWIQDPEHDMWTGRTIWMDVKQDGPTPKDARYFNGALFGAFKLAGDLTVRNCDVAHAFNAIRLEPGTGLLSHHNNRNIRIIGNRFSFIRDNVVEPEGVATNLWVVDNTIFNSHAAFSTDGVGGSHWYFFGNRILNARRPSLAPPDDNTGGTIFKLSPTRVPAGPFHAAFNSVQTRTTYARDGGTRHWDHRNNAIGICRSGPDCNPLRKMFRSDFRWHPSYAFANDLCDHPHFPDRLAARGYRVAGIRARGGTFAPRDPAFLSRDPDARWDGILTLAQDSPGNGTSIPMRVALPHGRAIDIPGGRDIGAAAPDVLLEAAESVRF